MEDGWLKDMLDPSTIEQLSPQKIARYEYIQKVITRQEYDREVSSLVEVLKTTCDSPQLSLQTLMTTLEKTALAAAERYFGKPL
jgi:hypothetical protein